MVSGIFKPMRKERNKATSAAELQTKYSLKYRLKLKTMTKSLPQTVRYSLQYRPDDSNNQTVEIQPTIQAKRLSIRNLRTCQEKKQQVKKR